MHAAHGYKLNGNQVTMLPSFDAVTNNYQYIDVQRSNEGGTNNGLHRADKGETSIIRPNVYNLCVVACCRNEKTLPIRQFEEVKCLKTKIKNFLKNPDKEQSAYEDINRPSKSK